jgi:hypothetical protein
MTDRKGNHLCLKKCHEYGALLTFKGQWIFTLKYKDAEGHNEAQSAPSYRIHSSMTKHGQHFVPQSRKMLADDSVIITINCVVTQH